MPVRVPGLSLAPPKYQDANRWLREEREKFPGLTQKQVAREIGCSTSHWRHVEAGWKLLSYDLQIKYGAYLHLLRAEVERHTPPSAQQRRPAA